MLHKNKFVSVAQKSGSGHFVLVALFKSRRWERRSGFPWREGRGATCASWSPASSCRGRLRCCSSWPSEGSWKFAFLRFSQIHINNTFVQSNEQQIYFLLHTKKTL
jgi:hypothetical protein